jgi:hypothetical protein
MNHLSNRGKLIYIIGFSICLVFSIFAIFSALNFPYKYLDLDDFNHLARVRWSIFGERRITFLQREKPINYYWAFHFILKPFCYVKEREISVKQPKITGEKFDIYKFYSGAKRCIKVYSVLKALIVSFLFSIFIFVLIEFGFIRDFWGFLLPLSISPLFFHVQSGRLLSYIMFVLFIFSIYKRNYLMTFFTQIVWSNLHISATFGPFLAFFLMFFGRTERKFFVPIICFFCSLINPYHIFLYKENFDHIVYFLAGFFKEINFSKIEENKHLFYGNMISKLKLIIALTLFAIQVLSFGEKRKLIYFIPLIILPFFIRRLLFFPLFITGFHIRKNKLAYILSLIIFYPSIKLYFYYSHYYEYHNLYAEKLIFSEIFKTRCSGLVHSAFTSLTVFFSYPRTIIYYDFFTTWNKLEKLKEQSDTYEELIYNGVRCIVSSPQFYKMTPQRFPRAIIWRDGPFTIIDVDAMAKYLFYTR